ncbi:MAG: hypothetical protein WA192_11905 [Candidatus Acidiferrales bacterium]
MAGPTTDAVGPIPRRGSSSPVLLLAWKVAALCLLAFLFPALTSAQDSLRTDVGFGDYYSPSVSTPVRVYLPATPSSQSVELQFVIRSGDDLHRRDILRTDRILKHVQTQAGQPTDVEVPLPLPQATWSELDMTASTSDGHIIGAASRNLGELVALAGGQYLVAIYCTDQKICQDVQAQLAFGGNGEQSAKKNRNLRLITFSEPLADWWAYSSARMVVLAGPVARFSTRERQALEDYARSGGAIAVLEDEVADKDFLAAYRQGVSSAAPLQVGRGRLFRLRSVPSNELAQVFSNQSIELQAALAVFSRQSAADFIRRTGIAFTFPSFRWLLIWLAIYLVVVGPINFAILRRLKRLEWGWTTVSVLAAVFAGGFYLSGSARRPASYTLDTATIYWMDGRSPVATEEVGVRVSAPHRGDVRLSILDEDLVLNTGPAPFDGASPTEIGADMTEKARAQQGWNADLGPPTSLDIPMLRWSFRDLEFEGFRKFPGTVHWTSAGKLQNDTGVSFSEAMYFDFSANKEYALAHVAAGQEISLSAINAKEIYTSEYNAGLTNGIIVANLGSDSRTPFSVAELPYDGFQFKTGQMFAGLSNEPSPNLQLQPPAPRRNAIALTLVSVGAK